jgi:hypothetical protein
MSRMTSLHTWGAATRTTSAATAIRTGSYSEGQWFIRVIAVSGTNPRVRPAWQAAPGTSRATVAPFVTTKLMATLMATGLAIATLSYLGSWGRPHFTVSGTGAAIRLQSWLVAKW